MYNSSVAVTPAQPNAYDNEADENKKKGAAVKMTFMNILNS